VDLASTDGRLHARAVVTTSGTGFLDTAGLPAPPSGSIYQLWGINGSSAPVSLGLVPAGATVAVFTTTPAAFDTLAITQEAPAGSQAPTAAPLVAGALAPQ
jgi:anti-sigma-K factor RskA